MRQRGTEVEESTAAQAVQGWEEGMADLVAGVVAHLHGLIGGSARLLSNSLVLVKKTAGDIKILQAKTCSPICFHTFTVGILSSLLASICVLALYPT